MLNFSVRSAASFSLFQGLGLGSSSPLNVSDSRRGRHEGLAGLRSGAVLTRPSPEGCEVLGCVDLLSEFDFFEIVLSGILVLWDVLWEIVKKAGFLLREVSFQLASRY